MLESIVNRMHISFKGMEKTKKAKGLWHLSYLVNSSVVWGERNNHIFDSHTRSEDKLCGSTQFQNFI